MNPTSCQVKTKYDLAKLRLVNGVSEEEEETELELVFEKGSNLMSPLTIKWSAERYVHFLSKYIQNYRPELVSL